LNHSDREYTESPARTFSRQTRTVRIFITLGFIGLVGILIPDNPAVLIAAVVLTYPTVWLLSLLLAVEHDAKVNQPSDETTTAVQAIAKALKIDSERDALRARIAVNEREHEISPQNEQVARQLERDKATSEQLIEEFRTHCESHADEMRLGFAKALAMGGAGTLGHNPPPEAQAVRAFLLMSAEADFDQTQSTQTAMGILYRSLTTETTGEMLSDSGISETVEPAAETPRVADSQSLEAQSLRGDSSSLRQAHETHALALKMLLDNCRALASEGKHRDVVSGVALGTAGVPVPPECRQLAAELFALAESSYRELGMDDAAAKMRARVVEIAADQT